MTSLIPGAIFQSPGLNRNSTPTPPNITPAQLDNRYSKGDFDGKTWPHDSPVSRIYDVQNTSTKMIILNNKYGKSGTRLRGYYSGPQKPDRTIDPNRHRAMSPRNPEFHVSCYDSSSPKFEPAIKVNLEWSNSDWSNRTENSLAAGTSKRKSADKNELKLDLQGLFRDPDRIKMTRKSKEKPEQSKRVRTSVNQKRHISCQTPREMIRLPSEDRHRLPMPPARFFSAKEFSDMSLGEKIYMWSIEKIYNVENMKKLKQDQYKKLLQLEAKKGYYGQQEYQKYMRYINSATSRSYGTGTPRTPQSPAGSRSRSAFSTRSTTSPNKTESKQDTPHDKADEKSEEQSRPKTSLGTTRSESPTKDISGTKTKEQESTSPPKSPPKSPSPSRKSSARSTKSAYSSYSNRSIKSKHSYRPPSTSSSRHSVSLRKAESSDSAFSGGEIDSIHKEGRDRPKSRLGHMTPDDRDKNGHHSSLSSLSSIRSDKPTLTDESGKAKGKAVEKGKDANDEKKNEPRKISTSSRGSRSSLGSSVSLSSKHSSSSNEPHKKKESPNTAQSNVKNNADNKRTVAKPMMVHRVPSGTFEKELSNQNEEISKADKKPEEKTAEENQKGNDATKQVNPVDEVVDKREINSEEDNTAKNKSNESQNDTNEKVIEDKNETKAGSKEGADKISNEKPEEIVPENIPDQSKTNANNKDETINKPEREVIDEAPGNTEMPTERKDSLEEEDEDRRVNKDLDKIEY